MKPLKINPVRKKLNPLKKKLSKRKNKKPKLNMIKELTDEDKQSSSVKSISLKPRKSIAQ